MASVLVLAKINDTFENKTTKKKLHKFSESNFGTITFFYVSDGFAFLVLYGQGFFSYGFFLLKKKYLVIVMLIYLNFRVKCSYGINSRIPSHSKMRKKNTSEKDREWKSKWHRTMHFKSNNSILIFLYSVSLFYFFCSSNDIFMCNLSTHIIQKPWSFDSKNKYGNEMFILPLWFYILFFVRA